MIGSVERYSSDAARRRATRAVFGVLKVLLVALVLFLLVTRFLLSTYRIDSVSMSPALSPSDRVIVSALAYGPRVPFSTARLPGRQAPARGDIVVVQPPFFLDAPLLTRIFEPLVGFFTAQRASLNRDLYNGRVNGFMVKRIIGLPGDTLRLSGYTVSIRPVGASDFLPEDQLIHARYMVSTLQGAPGVGPTTPLGGSGAEITLGSDEYYVLGDNRPDSSDSRSWGPLKRDRIQGKVIYRYWPPGNLGSP